jgi:hypothetical protein
LTAYFRVVPDNWVRFNNGFDQPQNIEALKLTLAKLWGEITLDQFRNLYRGMPKRLESLRVAQGWNTTH